jgi:hypothetical protein
MSDYQLLDESELLKIGIDDLRMHYKLLKLRYEALKASKVIYIDKAQRRKDIINQFRSDEQAQHLRDIANGSQAHADTNAKVSEAIRLWQSLAKEGEFLNALELGRIHHQESLLPPIIQILRVPVNELQYPESAEWSLSYSVYKKIYTALNKAKRDPGIHSKDFHDATLRYKR